MTGRRGLPETVTYQPPDLPPPLTLCLGLDHRSNINPMNPSYGSDLYSRTHSTNREDPRPPYKPPAPPDAVPGHPSDVYPKNVTLLRRYVSLDLPQCTLGPSPTTVKGCVLSVSTVLRRHPERPSFTRVSYTGHYQTPYPDCEALVHCAWDEGDSRKNVNL